MKRSDEFPFLLWKWIIVIIVDYLLLLFFIVEVDFVIFIRNETFDFWYVFCISQIG